ncbi:MAG: B12-binding domain-containing radical SAM protein [Thermodesulfovibrio sp.]|nr:B12-binding domain-containing radical SAM protein [Thermodesulfovibrio sp.]
MRILLINPKRVGRGQASVRYMNATPLALPILKALTPEDIEVRIIDENHSPIPYEEHWDLVGITVMMHVSPSARAIAKVFRSAGIKVAFGGFFPTLNYDDVREHVDSVIAGEAEHVWPEVIKDLRNNQLKPYYKAEQLIDLKDIPFIKKEFFSAKDEFYHIETTRGCPYNCDFCAVTNFYGAKFRHRPIDHVVRQIEELKGKAFFFVDDNIMGEPAYARDLFREIIPLKIKWSGQFSLNHAANQEVMGLAAESGCQFLFTGIESLSQDNLQAVDKKWAKSEKFAEWIKMTHDTGIGIYGSFMFGFEGDDKNVFQRTLEFCEDNEIELALFSALFPMWGSKLYAQLQAENRIFETDVTKFNGQYSTFHPKNMTSEELNEGLRWLWNTFYSKPSIKKRLGRRMRNQPPGHDENGFPNTTEVLMGLNIAFKVAVEDF